MKIRILTIGKLKEKYLVNGINEYVKRLNAYCKVEMVEVPDEPIPDNASENVENIIKDKEADKIVSKIKDDEYVIVLDLHGKEIVWLFLSILKNVWLEERVRLLLWLGVL